MHNLHDATIALGASTDPRAVLERLINACAQFVPYHACALVVPTRTPDEVAVCAGRNLSPDEVQATWTPGIDVRDVLLGEMSGILADHGRAALHALPSVVACSAILLLPLRSATSTDGVLVLGGDAAQFTCEAIDDVRALAAHGTLALHHVRLRNELHGERKMLLQYETELRRKLNRDLHDGPAQAFATMTLQLSFIKRLQQVKPNSVPHELDAVIALAQRMSRDMRTMLFDLRPIALEQNGLADALQQYFARFADQPTTIAFHSDDLHDVERYVQYVLFGIVQEAVNNAMAHAQARTLNVTVTSMPNHVVLRVADDGQGFDLAAMRKHYTERGGLGLLAIEERAKLVNGTSDIRSAPDHGTTVQVVVPLNR
jgi:signal transduction histidine kinase